MSRSVNITIGKKEYRLLFDHNAMADLEEKVGLGVIELFQRQMGFASTRALLYAGLKHQEPGITLQRAGLLLNTYCKPVEERGNGGDLDTISTELMRAIARSGLFKGITENTLANAEEIEVPDVEADDESGEAPASANDGQ